MTDAPKPPRWRRLLVLGPALVFVAIFQAWPQPEPELRFLAVGQGDAILLRDRTTTALIDAGPADAYRDAGARIVGPRLRHLGISDVDLVILTHPDADHVGGLPALAMQVKVRAVAASEEFRGSPDLAQVLREAAIPPERVIWLRDGTRLGVGRFALELRCPKVPIGGTDNDGSILMKVRHGAATAVLTGDAPIATEEAVLRQMDWRAQVLKAGHHGSAGSTGEAFLAAVRPRWVVVSAGRNNRYDHPNRAVLERVEAARARVLRTDRQGDVVFKVRPEGFVRWGPEPE